MRRAARGVSAEARVGTCSPPPIGALLGLALLVASAMIASYPGRLRSEPIFISPHENVRFHLAQEWTRSGMPSIALAVPGGLPDDFEAALLPRDAALQDGHVVPKDFPYAVALVASLAAADPRAAATLGILSSAALLVGVGLLAHKLSDSRRASVVAAVLIGTSPSFWSGSAGLIESGATAAAVYVFGLLYLARVWQDGAQEISTDRRNREALTAGALLGASVGVHFALALLTAPVILAVVASVRRRTAPSWWVAAGAIGALLPVVLYNWWLHGSPLVSGYGLGERFYDEYFRHHAAGLLDLRIDLLWRHFTTYMVRPEVLALVALAALAVRGVASRHHRFVRGLGPMMGLGAVTYIAFVGARPLFGDDGYQGNASFLRYLLPVMAVAVSLAATGARHHSKGRLQATEIALAAVAFLGLAVTVTSDGSLLEQPAYVHHGAFVRDVVLAATEPEAVVISARSDKYLWPDRATVTVGHLVRSAGDGQTSPHLYDAVPDAARLVETLESFARTPTPTYILDDGWVSQIPDLRGLGALLSCHGLRASPTGIAGLTRYEVMSSRGRVGVRAARQQSEPKRHDDTAAPSAPTPHVSDQALRHRHCGAA